MNYYFFKKSSCSLINSSWSSNDSYYIPHLKVLTYYTGNPAYNLILVFYLLVPIHTAGGNSNHDIYHRTLRKSVSIIYHD